MISHTEAIALYDRCVDEHHPMMVMPISEELGMTSATAHECHACSTVYFFDEFGDLVAFARISEAGEIR